MKTGETSNIPRLLRQVLKLARNHGEERDRELASIYQVKIEQVIFELEGQERARDTELTAAHEK